MAKKMYAFRINTSLLDEAETYSQENHSSVSELIRQALFSYLSQIKQQQKRSSLYE